MQETGLMFKAPLVRAILDGTKTQTRRPVKWSNLESGLNLGFSGLKVFSDTPGTFTLESQTRTGWERRSSATGCPLGRPGDRIYVRETFVQGFKTDPATGALRECDEDGNDVPMSTWYRASDNEIGWTDGDGWATNVPWRSSAQMPKSAARIWLEVTDVRVERLQAITEADCVAEGAFGGMGLMTGPAHCRHIWESTGGDWAANPWVWVVNFKRITP